MENTDSSQLELFSQGPGTNPQAAGSRKYAFIARIWGYEKNILILVAIIITGVVSFSLGVEKGRRLSSPGNARLDIATKPLFSRVEPTKQPSSPVKALGTPLETLSPQTGSYTIQLASYKTRSYAQKEVQALKKKGLSALILSKKGYAVLCVGSFANKEEALGLLSELKKRYQDCHIRRL